jgi:sarcosine oxidase subunit beta
MVHSAIAMQNEIGIPTRFVAPDELNSSLPQLNTHGMVGAVHDPTAGISRHDALVWGYANAASRLGVHIHAETAVTGMVLAGDRIETLETSRGDVDAEIVINCAGSGSAGVAQMAGIDLSLRQLTLEMFVTEPFARFFDPVVSVIEDQAYIVQTSRGEFVGGAEPIGHLNDELASSRPAVRQSAAALTRLFPGLAGVNMLRSWAGLIDMSPDGAGLVGEMEERPGFFLDCGWGGEGYMVAPATGKLGAEYINSGTMDPRLAAFHHKRFETGETLSDDFLVVDAAGETRA